jgi:hypothetical protein
MIQKNHPKLWGFDRCAKRIQFSSIV